MTSVSRCFEPLLAVAVLVLPLAAAAQSPFFTPGNLAVLRVGDTNQVLAESGNTVYIDQFTPGGTLVNSVMVPDAGDGALLVTGTAGSEGELARSLDGTLLAFAGYHVDLGAVNGSLPNQSGAAVPRALGTVSTQGLYTLVQTSPTVYSGKNIRGAAADGTNNFWTAGTPNGTYWFNPPQAPVSVQTSGGNTTVVRTLGGNLYFSTQKGANGIYTFQGGGLPTTPTPTNLLFATGPESQPAGFDLSPDLTLAYVADQRISAGGGIEKWTNGLGTWTLAYTLSTGPGSGAYSVAVDFSGPNPVLYATTVDSDSSTTNRLVSLVDTGPDAVPVVLAASGATAFRGLDFVPEPLPPIFQDFRISAFSPNGLLCWTNASAAGVCTVESAGTPQGPWLPLLCSFTTNSAGQAGFTPPPPDAFYRLLGVDISAVNPTGFSNLTRSYGNLHTVAGSGNDGGVDGVDYWQTSFEGGFATNAALSRPHIAFADLSSNLFLVDKDSHSVLKITPDGRIHTIAGTHAPGNGPDTPTPATNVALSFPNGLWLGGDGALYVLDTGNNKVRWLDTNGLLTTLFTDTNGITEGRGLWVKDDRTLAYYADGHDLNQWTPVGGIQTVNKASFNDLANFIVNPAGNLIVTDRGANEVYLLPTSGASAGYPVHLFGNGGAGNVVDGTLASTNELYQVRAVWPVPTGGYLLGTDGGCQVLYVDTAGILHIFVDGQEDAHSGDGQWFYSPGYKVSEVRSVTMDARGTIFIVENDVGYVRRVDFLRLTP